MPENLSDHGIPMMRKPTSQFGDANPNCISPTYAHPPEKVIISDNFNGNIDLANSSQCKNDDQIMIIENLSMEKSIIPPNLYFSPITRGIADPQSNGYDHSENKKIDFKNKSVLAKCKKCNKMVKTKVIHTFFQFPMQYYCCCQRVFLQWMCIILALPYF